MLPIRSVPLSHLFFLLALGTVLASSVSTCQIGVFRGDGGGGRNRSIRNDLLAGGCSRAVAQMLLYPIDALRTLAQSRDGRTLADVGSAALVRGCTTTSSFALLMGSIQFAVFEYVKPKVPAVVASAVSAAASCIVSVPQEVIKQRLVTGVYDSFRNAVSSIYQSEGVTGFYSAWKPTMARNVPFVMTTFTTMELLKQRRLQQKPQRNDLHVLEHLAIGMASALVAGLITQPIDVIKTRLMTQEASKAIPYKNAIDCFVQIVKTEGPLTLYAGMKQRAAYMCLLWGITFTLNGKLHEMLANAE